MTIRDVKGRIQDEIPVRNVLISVFDKTGLGLLVPALVETNPDVRILSTGGTHNRIANILGGDASKNLMEVADYTGFPEMEGGLVKTLHPKIHAGILGERGNPAHQEYLKSMDGDYIDMVVVNLYPFDDVVTEEGVTIEKARGHIDIGGPTMLRAAAKNFMSCAAVCDIHDYGPLVQRLRESGGTTNLGQRFGLARKVFQQTGKYDASIGYHFANQVPEDVASFYGFGNDGGSE